MYKRGETSGEPMAYKNTLMHVKKLESLGFIEPTRQKYTKHGAIYYRISEAGMFQLFLKRPFKLQLSLFSILDNHGNYSIFDAFLYPCFKKETLAAVNLTLGPIKFTTITFKGTGYGMMGFEGTKLEIANLILEYLNGCCKELYSVIRLKDLPGSQARRYHLDRLDSSIALLKKVLVMQIFLRHPDETDQKNILSILAHDDKFMNIAHDLQKDFNRSFDFAKHLRTRS